MKRDPSIHITRSSLSEILGDLLEGDVDYIVGELFRRSNSNAIRNRVIVSVKAAAKKKMARVASVDKEMTERFHLVYQQVNQQNSIRTSAIKQTDSKYATLKEVAQQASEFCKMFDLEENFGFQTYVTIGIKLSQRSAYSIYRLKGLADRIIKYYEDMSKISTDENEQGTRAFYVAWKQACIKYMGQDTAIEEPHLFVHFIHGRMAADKEKAKYSDWVSAQFERWDGSMPELSQFYGDNASLAYTKFVGLTSKKYKSDEEKEYFEKGEVRVKTVKRRKGKGKA